MKYTTKCNTRPDQKWWGWGDPRETYILAYDTPAWRYLVEKLKLRTTRETQPVDYESVVLKTSRLSEEQRKDLEQIVGAEHLSQEKYDRLSHSMGKSYRDLVRLRAGNIEDPPDAVVMPANHDEVQQLLDLAAERAITIVPYGGGSSVVGGVETFGADDDTPVVSLDLSRLNRIRELDHLSRTALIQAGIYGPDLEMSLAKVGLTLGHIPQSFEYSTLGGWIATRSAGQLSAKYGKIEDMVTGLKIATPIGSVDIKEFPASASGPDFLQALIGTEGILGVITEAIIKLQPIPQHKEYRGYSVPSFTEGYNAIRELMQRDLTPVVCRLSDEDETASMIKLGTASSTWFQNAMNDAALYALGMMKVSPADGCLMLIGYEGGKHKVLSEMRDAHHILRKHGGFSLGSSPTHKWERQRFKLPYMRDVLLGRGVMVDTLETATSWRHFAQLHQAVKNAVQEVYWKSGRPGLVFAHLSHAYADGASLYFTMIVGQDADDPIGQWEELKQAATDAIVANHGTISHHHAVGYEHRPWMKAQYGEKGLEILRALKEKFDPKGIMNPGKLLPE